MNNNRTLAVVVAAVVAVPLAALLVWMVFMRGQSSGWAGEAPRPTPAPAPPSSSPPASATAVPSPSVSSPGGAGLVGPVMVDPGVAHGAVYRTVMGRPVVFAAPGDVTDWQAEILPPGIVSFLPGHAEGGAVFNPAFEPVSPGTATVLMNDTVSGARITFTVVVTDAPATPQPGPSVVPPPPSPPSGPGQDWDRVAVETQWFADTLVGLPEDDATEAATRAGYTVRVVSRDGEGFAITMDYSPTRIDLDVDEGVVTAARVG